jgi:zinc/manganese transport system permease protein
MDTLLAFWPALAGGLLVAATHVPLGIQVLARGIVFIDLAVAQIAGLGIVAAGWAGLQPHGAGLQLAAFGAALGAAFLFAWTERRWPEVQEAVIGVVFIVAASASLLLLAASPQGAEHLRDLLAGKILWLGAASLPYPALASAAIVAAWFAAGPRLGRAGFYALFACAVTVSVQLVGLYLVFATLIVPALASRAMKRGRLAAGYAIAALAYIGGLMISGASDLPPAPLIVCAMALLGLPLFLRARA